MSKFNLATINEFSKDDKEIYGFLEATRDMNQILCLTLYGAQTKKGYGPIFCERNAFARDYVSVFRGSKLKALIFEIDGSPDNVPFIRVMQSQFALAGIPYVLFTNDEQMRSAILVEANLALKVGDRIVEVLIDDDGFVVSELIFTDKGYLECDQRDCKPYKKMTAAAVRQRILGPNNPVKIVCHANSPGKAPTKFLTKNVLNDIPSAKLMILEENLEKYEAKFVYETVKWMFDKDYTRFYVCQKAFRDYMIRGKYGKKYFPLIVCKKNEILPFKQEVIIPKSYLDFYFAMLNFGETAIVDNGNKLDVPKEVHALKIALEIDVSNFGSMKIRGQVYNKISRFCAHLDTKELTIPVIGLCGELSFIYVKTDDGYKFLDGWNGKLGKDLYICVEQENPVFFESAVKKFLEHNNSVVHDLIKIMSTSSSALPKLQTFGYSITSDSDRPVLIETKNHLGEKKASTPAFYMAQLLKEHLKALEAKLGTIPNEIGFCIFDDFDGDAEAKKRVENGLKDACKMLNGLECCFFEAV